MPKSTQFRDGDVDLWVSNATYAFVRFVGPARHDCPQHIGPRCIQDRVSWVHRLHDNGGLDGLPPSRRHDALFGIPPIVSAPRLDVYLFTDGRATLRIRTTSLRGRTTYRPNAKFRGYAGVIPQTCVPLGCADATGRSNGYTHGGTTYDLQGPGWSEYYAVSRTDSAGTLPNNGNQVRSVTACIYPGPGEMDASPEAADHPHGCDDDAGTPAAARRTAGYGLNLGTGVTFTSASGRNMMWTGGNGRQYVGFQALSAGPGPSRALAYGIWFRYLP